MWQLGTAGPQRVDRICSYGAADIWGQRVWSELRCLCAKHLRGRAGVAHTCYWLHQEASGLLRHLRDLTSLGHNPSHKDHPKDHRWLFKRDQQSASMVLKTLVAMFPHVPSLGCDRCSSRAPGFPKFWGKSVGSCSWSLDWVVLGSDFRVCVYFTFSHKADQTFENHCSRTFNRHLGWK